MAATCDGLRVRLKCDLQFHGTTGKCGFFTIESGTVCEVVDTEETRGYAKKWKRMGKDLIPVRLQGMVRFVERDSLEMVRNA